MFLHFRRKSTKTQHKHDEVNFLGNLNTNLLKNGKNVFHKSPNNNNKKLHPFKKIYDEYCSLFD